MDHFDAEYTVLLLKKHEIAPVFCHFNLIAIIYCFTMEFSNGPYINRLGTFSNSKFFDVIIQLIK